MIGYLGDIIFETSDKKICNFKGLKRSISANYSEHKRYKKKSQREFEGAENQGVKIRAVHGVKPKKMMDKVIKHCQTGDVLPFMIGGHRVGGGKWTIDSVDATYNEVWNRGELVSVSLSITATEYY